MSTEENTEYTENTNGISSKDCKELQREFFVEESANIPKGKKKPFKQIEDLTKSAAEYLSSKKVKKVRRIIWYSFVGIFVAFFLFFGMFAKSIFGEDSWIAEIAGENNIATIWRFLYDNLDKIFRTAATLILFYAVIWILIFVVRLFARGNKRRKTIVTLITSFIKYTGYILMFSAVLSIWFENFSMTTVLAGAGVLAIVIGLGAQSLMADILSGLFIIFENSFQVGDIITFEGFRGEVEEIGIRTTKIKSAVGDIKIINNSEIKTLINMSKHRSVAICEITIDYGENLERVEKIIKDNLKQIAKKFPVITDGPNYIGLAEFTERGTLLKITAKCLESERMQLTRDLNREFKLLFDKYNIKIAVPSVKVSQDK